MVELELFLRERTKFVLYFYRTSAMGFTKIISAIDNKEEPYTPQYCEDDEPPFLIEWMDAQTGLESVGYSALSILASSLKLYLEEWTIRIENPDQKFKRKHSKGWFYAYKKILGEVGLSLSECPANINLIEQVVLARNMVQHPGDLTKLEAHYTKKDLKKYPNLIFVSEREAAFLKESEFLSTFMMPRISVNESRLVDAVSHVEKFCSWLEGQYRNAGNA